jgi:hypothetical protein
MSKRAASSLQAATRREFLCAAALFGLAGMGRPLQALAAAGTAYQLGCYTRPWDQFDYRVALDGIAEAGFNYAGIMTAKGKSWRISIKAGFGAVP